MKYVALFFVCMLVVACSEKSTESEPFDASKVCPETQRGTFVDERDGQEYRYTTIGDQVWMAENLNYEMDGAEVSRWSSCNQQENCEIQGLMYELNAASLACPKGWRLPSKNDWNELFESVGGIDVAGMRLKSTSGWKPLNSGDISNGTDDCGFNAIPAVVTDKKNDGYEAGFLTTSLDEFGDRIYMHFTSYYTGVKILSVGRVSYIRCIKD